MNVTMERDELITVIIPVYNRKQYLSTAIDSIVAQTYPYWKLIIMDDASTDGTPDVVQTYLLDPRIHYKQYAENRGTGAILSEALSFIETPYFVILDSDDWLDIRTLDILLGEMAKQDASTGLVFGNTVSWSESDCNIRIKGIQRHRSFSNPYDFMLYRPMIFPRFFRTEAVRAVGGFELDDPHGGRYMEDRYLLLKLINKYKFHYVDCHFYHHRSHEANISGKNNLSYFENTRRYVYPKLLKQWGDEYEPIFEYSFGGWLHLHKLVPLSPDKPPLQADSFTMKSPSPSPTAKVTVVMPTYNRSTFIAESIQSILNQSIVDWHLLIIDDASTDQTEVVVAPYLQDPRISYVRRPVNGGIGSVLNDALNLIVTPYFMQLDADDWVEPLTLEALLSAMENASPDTALAYGNSMIHKKKQDGCYEATPQIHRTFSNKFDVLLYRWMVIPRFYRTSSVKAVGGWNLNVPFKGRHMEDRQMFYKLAENHSFLYVDQLFYHYRLHGTNLTLSNIAKYAEIRVYLMQYYFHKWNGRKETRCVLEWQLNAEGWPQFTLVPVKQRKKYVYYLGALNHNDLTERMIYKISKIASNNGHRRPIIVFTLDNMNVEGRYVRGFMLEDRITKGGNEEYFFPLPQSTIYLHDERMYHSAKKIADAIGCELDD